MNIMKRENYFLLINYGEVDERAKWSLKLKFSDPLIPIFSYNLKTYFSPFPLEEGLEKVEKALQISDPQTLPTTLQTRQTLSRRAYNIFTFL